MDCLPGSSLWDSPGKNTGVSSCSLLQGIFPTQGSNPGLPHCRQILYCLSHQGSLHAVKSSLLKEDVSTFSTVTAREEGVIWKIPRIFHLSVASLYPFSRKSGIHVLLINKNNNKINGISHDICGICSNGPGTSYMSSSTH